MTKTYSELRQDALFRCAADLYKVAIEVGNDTDPDTASTFHDRTWAASVIDSTYKKAYEIEQLGHEECIASTRWEARLARLRAQCKTTENRELKASILATLDKA